MKKINFLNERSDFVKEVLEKPPQGIVRWGSVFFFAFILLLLLLSWVIKYPDIIISEIVLTTENPPVYLSAKMDGKIDSILKENHEIVDQGDWIMVIESNTNLDHIKKLNTIIDEIKLRNYDTNRLDSLNLPILNVGEIQAAYNSLVKHILKYRNRIKYDNYKLQTDLNNLKTKQYNNLIGEARRDLEYVRKELKLAKKDLDRHKELLNKGVIALQKYEAIELKYLQANHNLKNSESNLIEIKSRKISLFSEGNNLEKNEKNEQLNSELNVLEAMKLVELSFIEWKKKHVLVSTVKGRLNFLDYLSKNQHLDLGEKVISIVPENDDYFGVLRMPIVNSGKVKIGQSVNIKLLGFPHEEFGMVIGAVENISEVPNEDFYLVKIKLSDGLKTTYNKKITFKQNISGSAEIVTEDLRLIERFLYTLTKAFR